MKLIFTTMLLITLVIPFCLADDYSEDALFTKLRTVKSQEEADGLFTDFVQNAPDLEFAHKLYSMWTKRSPEAASAAFETLKKDPEAAGRLRYFEGASLDGEIAKIEFARKAIAANKDDFEAYALMFDVYTATIFKKSLGRMQGGVSDDVMNKLDAGFSPDNANMVRIREWKKAGEHLLLTTKYMAYYAVYKNHPDDAYKYFKEADELGAGWLDYSHLAIQAVRNKKLEEAESYIDKYVDVWVRRGAVKENGRKDMTESLILTSLINGRAYDEAIARIKLDENYAKNPDAMYNLAAIHARKKANKEVFKCLEGAIENGFDNVSQLNEDPDFKLIREQPEWSQLIKKVEAKWEEGAAEREKIALKMKIDKPAADWELKDPSGKTYKLSDYKNKKVVVLDFWATWCNPCMMAMPELDKWCKNSKPADVEVFSINTWERKTDAAKKLFVDRKFAMKLLMNGDTTAKNYGVTGIPYICVIGKDGKIRYEVKGFSPDLEKNLTIWVKDLLK